MAVFRCFPGPDGTETEHGVITWRSLLMVVILMFDRYRGLT
jgi:hypothetical protein